jgi:hypothetical protein
MKIKNFVKSKKGWIQMVEENIHSVNTDMNEDGMSIESRQKIFVLYFKGLERVGAPYGIWELTKKAKELKLPIPSRQEIKSWKRKYIS